MITEENKIELPQFIKDKVAGPTEEQNAMAATVKDSLESDLGKDLEGFLVIALPREGSIQMVAMIPDDPWLRIRMAKAAAKATETLLS